MIEVDARFEVGMRRALAMFEEMEQLALTTPASEVVGVVKRRCCTTIGR
jgi:hypothetical protein